MKHRSLPGHRLVSVFVVCVLPATAAPITWIGGNIAWVDGAGNASWSPADEPDADDEAIFNTANVVGLGSNNSILALTLSGGIDLSTAGNDLTVDGLVQLAGAGTQLIINASTSVLSADSVTINSGGTIVLDSGFLTVVEETGSGLLDINSGGTLSGSGTVGFNDALAAATTLVSNDGTLSASFPGFTFGSPPAGSLILQTADPSEARIDLDGVAGNGVVNVFRNQSLDIGLTLIDSFSGDLNLFHNTTLTVASGWAMDSGTLDVDNGFIAGSPPLFPDVPASTAFLAGGTFTQTGGTITNLDGDGTIQFNAPFTMNGGILANNGRVVFGANANIAAAANFTMPTATSSLTVNPGVVVNIDQTLFNADGAGTPTNVITLQSGAILDLDLGVGAETGIGSTLNLNGGELDVTTDSNIWSLDRAVNVGAATGNSTINGEALTFLNTTVTVGNGSSLDVNASSSWTAGASATVGSGSTLRLNGPATTLGGASFTGAGTLLLGSTSIATAATTISTGTFDWDGIGSGTLHTINDGVAFTITSPVFDSDGDMDDPINLGGSNATLTVNGPAEWTMRRTLTANPGVLGTSFINGTSRLILADATGILNVDGNTTINAPLTYGPLSATDIDAGQTLNANGNTIHDGGSISGAGTYLPGTVNTIASSSSITAATFDFDDGNWTVQPGATFSVSVTDYDTVALNAFNATITVNSGTVSLFTGDPAFILDGTLNLNHGAGPLTQWIGESLEIGNDDSSIRAELNTGGTGQSTIFSPVTFNSDADVNIDADAALNLAGTASFDTVNGANNASFTGSGILVFSGAAVFNEAVTFNMSGGTIDPDGLDGTGNIHVVDAPVVMNLAALASFGRVNGSGTNTFEIDHFGANGSLTVNLDDPAGRWTLNAPGLLSLINDTSEATLLAGADIQMNGTVNVLGDVRSTARLDIAGTVNITSAGQPFRLGGGTLGSDPNTLEGGTINGPGPLGCDSGTALTGFGTIAAPVDFDGSSDLRADNGTLILTGGIVDARNVGTADADGILNVPAAWNSSSILTVSLSGGQLTGGALTLDNTFGMNGFGTVSSRVINNSQIQESSSSNVLLLQTAANDNDWDGTTNAGILSANFGTLELRDNAVFGFTGTASAISGGTVFTNGFALDFNPGSTLDLDGSTYRSTHTTNLGGSVLIGAGPDSVIDIAVDRFLDFEATSTTTLNGNLQLVSNNAKIDAGATFSGGGSLIVPASGHLIAVSGSIVNVLLDLRGTFRTSGIDAVGRVDVKDYQQSPTGTLIHEISGTALNQFDRLVVNGAAQLDGILSLDLDGGFLPTLGQTFNIISTSSGVSGTFDSVGQPGPMPAGLKFQVNYLPTLVQLEVVAKTPYDTWIDSFVSLTDPLSKLKTANPDHDALNNLGEFALDDHPASGVSSGKIVGKIAPVGVVNAMTLTFPVRTGAIADPADLPGGPLGLRKTADAVAYSIQASDNLSTFPLDVTEVLGVDATAIQAGLPGVHTGWGYRTFRSPGPVAGDPVEFMRVVISE